MGKIKDKKDNLSIKWKIFLYLMGFCAILLAVLWLFQVTFLPSFYKRIKIKQLNTAAAKIETVLTKDEALTNIDEIASDNEVCVLVIEENGVEVYSADVLKDCVLHKMPFFDLIDIMVQTKENGGELNGFYSHKTPAEMDKFGDKVQFKSVDGGSQTMIYSKRIAYGQDSFAYMILNIQLSPVNATVSTLRVQYYVIAAFMIIFCSILAAIISKKVAKPIEQITKDSLKLATGDYETVFNAGGYKEINQLSDTLNYTAGELSKVENLRRDFIANVSHDLRTPLTLISGYAEVMRDIPGENNSENAQVIIDEAQRLSSLVSDVLDLSKLQSGSTAMKQEDFSLTKMLGETVRHMNELLKKEGYSIEFNGAENIIVNADKSKISQCFYNMLTNAANYTGTDKKIYVNQETKENLVRVSVIDTGEGVSEKDMPYVWQRYYKSDKNHKRAITGTGIGLSIVQSVIKAHGGSCGAYNTKDKGACFWFELKIK